VIYIEFIERDRFLPIEIFRQLARQSSDWAEASQDRLLLQIGRTLRLGPMPSYLAFWEIPDIERLDAWEVYFASLEAMQNPRSQAMHRAIHIQRAGLYQTCFKAEQLAYPLYYLEYYNTTPANGACPSNPPTHLDSLILDLRRIGYLGPQPESIRVWGCSSYSQVKVLSEQHRQDGVAPADAGVYRDLGTETH